MSGAIAKAVELSETIPGSIICGQFENPANPQAHYLSTGPEIWQDTEGKLDVFVAGVGTGGTLTGTGRYLKEKKPHIQITAIEPADSPLLTAGKAGPHGLQGIGANFIPEILDRSLIDNILTVTQEEATSAARLLARKEGILCGISSGAALHGALKIAKDETSAGKTIVVLLPDSGERYLSTSLFG
jgi:cysteine synthase A